MVAFGKGTQNCIGINVGMAEICVALTSVVCQPRYLGTVLGDPWSVHL
jgi:hypothetical protein